MASRRDPRDQIVHDEDVKNRDYLEEQAPRETRGEKKRIFPRFNSAVV